MHSMIPMLADSPVLAFSLAPHFVWVMLAVLLVAGVAIAGSVLRAEQRRRAAAARSMRGRSARRILHDAQRPIAA
jgi:hypothetical protein